MESKTINLKHSVAAMTLPEMVVAVGLGSLLLLGLASFYLFSLRSFTSIGNYTELNVQSRNASDIMSRDLRCASSVVSASANQTSTTTNTITLSPANSSNLIVYTYNPAAQTLTRAQGTSSRILLTGVRLCTFSLYQRPTNNTATYEQFPPASPATAKLVSVNWSCSRTVNAVGVDSETIQTAMVNLRNQ